MLESERQLLELRVRRAIDLLAAHITIDAVQPAQVDILEPAPASFDAPSDQADWQPIGSDRRWGAKQQWTHFRGSIAVPSDWTDTTVELRFAHERNFLEIAKDDNFAAGPEGQLFVDGEPVGGIDHRHEALRYPFKAGKTYDIRAVFFAARCACRHRLARFELVRIAADVEHLYHDLRVAMEIYNHCEDLLLARQQMFDAVVAAVEALDLRGIENPLAEQPQRDPSGSLFRQSIAAAQQAFDEKRQAIEDAPHAIQQLLGHAHIDLAWLWPHTTTRHKNARTFATQDRLLRQYDEWVFQQSSPQAYEWLSEDAPELFKKVRKWVEDGRWEADGATWCEMDTNATSGESLVRQLLYGKRYFRDELGVESRMLWVPDVFGYSGALPQLLAKAGVDLFVTSKISWSLENQFPHDTFRWQGVDGSEVLVHFITTTEGLESSDVLPEWRRTYNGRLTVREVRDNWKSYKHRNMALPSLNTFGWGDGGGGPTELMLETARRLADWSLPGDMPRVRHGKAYDLYPTFDARRDELPIWRGELYLEYHRGTYTSHGWLKRANRKNENLLHNVEWLASIASRGGFKLDKPALDKLWKDLLFCQFHDILPGTSVHEEYDLVRPMQRHIAESCRAMIDAAADTLADQIDVGDIDHPMILFNTLGWDRSDPVKVDDDQWIDGVTIPAGGWTVIDADSPVVSDEPSVLTISEDGHTMANSYWKLRFADDGSIEELYDRTRKRSVLAPGQKGNLWQIFEDRPHQYDAWEVDPGTYDQPPLPAPTLESMSVVESGRVRVAVELVWTLPPSPPTAEQETTTIRQRVALYAGNPRIDFETTVDWHEHHQLLKVAFPVDVYAQVATYEVQFGAIQRPTHRNTTWDRTKFEVPAQRWIDLSEHGFGVALLNDCKYGFDVLDNVMRMTCIKSAQAPDRLADQGRHQFTYALLPHGGDLQAAGVIRAAAELNQPPVARSIEPTDSKKKQPGTFRFLSTDHPAVNVDTVKPAEDGKGWIVRLYESFGGKATTTVTFGLPINSATQVNLLEDADASAPELEVNENSFSVTLKPFEVVSIRVRS